MYRKNKNNWVKHLDFMILDLICLQVAFFLAYTLRHRTVKSIYQLHICKFVYRSDPDRCLSFDFPEYT